MAEADPLLSLRGSGRRIWADEHADDYVTPASRRVGMSRVFWDTNLYIYLFEGHGAVLKQVSSLRQAMLARGDTLVTSSLTLGEILVKPVEQGEEIREVCGSYNGDFTNLAVRCREVLPNLNRSRMRPVVKAAGQPQFNSRVRPNLALISSLLNRMLGCIPERFTGIQFIVPLERAPL